MNKSSLIFIIFFICVVKINAQEVNNETREKFDPAKDPVKELKAAVKDAVKMNKRIMLDVGGEWCIWCHRIDDFIQQNENIKKLLDDNYIVVKINYSEENKNEKFLAKYPKVDGYPHFFVLDKKGKLLKSQNTGLLENEKSYDQEKFIEFLTKWSAKK